MLNIAYMTITEVEGPGVRLAIWFQGCLKRCKGCCNQDMLDIKPAILMDEEELIEYIESIKDKIEGLTLLGGEPFLQAKNIVKILKKIDSNLSVIAFSGYTINELRSLDIESSEELLEMIDVLIDGEYDESIPEDTRKWIGSKNQNIYFFTDRYCMKDFDDKIDELEFHITKDKIFINGFPMQESI